ncbi:hypothetical protein [Phyllobacterium myrsinacearum]|uniref:DUF1795 domain-containing protein n=1 Tax=Phyllobacterium myrsinacearum TaxID=28101 RepID=A0A839EPD0_9HYPH|nr:hypothetical protein [Phyllobacterium myrsinacearum]MBA8880749.1 hypothetical protein [Phyllobacterium myrsinacearum]
MNIRTKITACIVSTLALAGPVNSAFAQDPYLDLIQGYRSNSIADRFPQTVGPFTLVKHSVNPQDFSVTAEYEAVDARASVTMAGVKASNKEAAYPIKDGADDPVVRDLFEKATQYHSTQPGEIAVQTTLPYSAGQAMPCVTADAAQDKHAFLVCVIGMHSRYLLIQPAATYSNGTKEAAERTLADFATSIAMTMNDIGAPPPLNDPAAPAAAPQ